MNKTSELEKLLQLIDDYEIISFDIFDTLLLRNVLKPADIFTILAKEVKEKFNIENFDQIRIDAEAKSRLPENGYETSLEKIYEAIPEITEEIKTSIKKMEMTIEDNFLIANPFMKQVFDYCKEKGKKIVCITDMYLPNDFLQKTLVKNGYGSVEIYLSCDFMKQKRDGSLFIEVYNETKFDKAKWLHIGDNIESDYNQPKNFGIAAYHYIKVADRIKIDKSSINLEQSIIYAIINNQIQNGLYDEFDSQAIIDSNLANIFFAFWLFNNLKNNDTIYIDYTLEPVIKILRELIGQDRLNIKINDLKKYNNDENVVICSLNLDKNINLNKVTSLLYEGVNNNNIKCFNKYSIDQLKLEVSLVDKLENYYKYLYNKHNLVIGSSKESSLKKEGFLAKLFKKHKTK